MKTVFILSNESRIVKATRCLDESTLWEAQGGFSVEVELGDYTELSSFINPDNEVYIQTENGNTLATFKTEIYNDPQEHLLHDCSASHYTNNMIVGRVIAFNKNLEDLNLTDYLKSEVLANCQELADNEQNELN